MALDEEGYFAFYSMCLVSAVFPKCIIGTRIEIIKCMHPDIQQYFSLKVMYIMDPQNKGKRKPLYTDVQSLKQSLVQTVELDNRQMREKRRFMDMLGQSLGQELLWNLPPSLTLSFLHILCIVSTHIQCTVVLVQGLPCSFPAENLPKNHCLCSCHSFIICLKEAKVEVRKAGILLIFNFKKD